MYIRIVPRVEILKLCMAVICLVTMMAIHKWKPGDVETETQQQHNNINAIYTAAHELIVERFYKQRECMTMALQSVKMLDYLKNWSTSALGSVLFKNKRYPEIKSNRKNKIFRILIWKNLDEAQTFVFGNNSVKQYLSDCSVQNCIFDGDDDALTNFDATVVAVKSIELKTELPLRHDRNQMFIFYKAESPVTETISSRTLIKLSNRFNWSMTYRADSDVPIPYGRVAPIEGTEGEQITTLDTISKLVSFWTNKTKRVLVAAIISNCEPEYRLNFIEELRKHITVHFFGSCGDDIYSCGHRLSTPTCIHRYHFYLALENSFCRQYLTEKVFVNAYSSGAIPIVKGPPAEDCAQLLPPNSYILVDNFKSMAHLVREILSTSKSDEKLLSYHVWRAHFKIVPENGFFGKKPIAFCRLCEAMNYNSLQRPVYTQDDILLHLDRTILCKET